MTFLESHEGAIRIGAFVGVFAVMAALEALSPRKERVLARMGRWTTNGALVVIDTLCLRLLIPLLAVGVADIAAREGWGLLNVVDAPFGVRIVVGVVLLDLAVYGQHVAAHAWPWFWRLHKVHHADRDIDVTTGARFHPLEIMISMAFKMACVAALGAPAAAVVLFEILLNASAMFNHANVRLPAGLDRLLRAVIVTPDVHRVHHSVHREETDSNFGFCLSVWDRMFQTYRAQPRDGHEAMIIGLPDMQDGRPASLVWSLLAPFRRDEPHRDAS